jgi:hypothetical protein
MLAYHLKVVNRCFDGVNILKLGIGAVLMTMRSVLMVVALTGLGILAPPASGISKTMPLLTGGGALDLSDSAGWSACCSVDDSILELGLPPTTPSSTQPGWKIEIEGAVSDASGYQEPETAASVAQTDPGTADLEAASVAAPPQSRLRRMFSAFIDFGANR